MPRGLPASYIKKAKRELGKGASWHDIFKRAWELYKGSKVYEAVSGNPSKKRGSRKKTSRKGGSRTVAKKKRRYRRSMTIPLAPVIGLAVGMAEPVDKLIKGDVTGAVHDLALNYTGFSTIDKKFHPEYLKKGLVPLIIGLLVHKFVGGAPLNLNRMLARHKIPLIRI